MISLDANIVIRVVVLDDLSQADPAQRLMRDNICFVARGVIQEAVWVLTKIYKFNKSQIAAFVDGLLSSAQITVENENAVSLALQLYKNGLDFADALHLATSQNCQSVATFDTAFIKAALNAKLPILVAAP